jgi:hypothetical protein
MARCVDCINKYTYNDISFEVQPCDGCHLLMIFVR